MQQQRPPAPFFTLNASSLPSGASDRPTASGMEKEAFFRSEENQSIIARHLESISLHPRYSHLHKLFFPEQTLVHKSYSGLYSARAGEKDVHKRTKYPCSRWLCEGQTRVKQLRVHPLRNHCESSDNFPPVADVPSFVLIT